MAKKNIEDINTQDAPDVTAEDTTPQTTKDDEANEATTGATTEEELSTLQKMKRRASEGDEAPAASLRFRDIVGGDYLWTVVRHHIWLIILIVFITTSYIAVRYQCQQDAIDISQLEKSLVDAKFQALSSSSNLTRMCRQSNVLQMLHQMNDSLLEQPSHPPFIIEVPDN